MNDMTKPSSSSEGPREFILGARMAVRYFEGLERIARGVGLRPNQVLRMAIIGLLRGRVDYHALPLISLESEPTRRVTIRLPPEVLKDFRQYCRRRGVFQEFVVNQLAAGLVEGRYRLQIPPMDQGEEEAPWTDQESVSSSPSSSPPF